MAYKYDVFISYRHTPPLCKNWVTQCFFETFRDHLESLGTNRNSVFIDKSIGTGDLWNYKLTDALLHSKIMIPFWTPSYFDDESYSLKELAIMNYRQRTLGIGKNKGFIMPILLAKEIDFFPNSELQCKNFRDFYYLPESAIKNDNLQIAIKEFAEEVDDRLRLVPKWNDEMGSEKWTLDYHTDLDILKKIYHRKEEFIQMF